jgi:LAO/AO transport system kinase
MMVDFLPEIQAGNYKTLAHCISLIENQADGSLDLLKKLPGFGIPVIGFTGAPGAGKSTIVNALIGTLINQNKKVAVLCIDPSSPFHQGAFLGDRIRMNQWAVNPSVFIRSLSARGSLGGLHPRIFEITDLLKAAPFDFILIETVGIGQSELEIAGIADFTVMILMPGSGDEIQALKAGVLEIADLFVINKSDLPGSREFKRHLQSALHLGSKDIDIIETVATEGMGISTLAEAIEKGMKSAKPKELLNLTEKAFRLILADSMKKIDKPRLMDKIKTASRSGKFNLYEFVESYLSGEK